MKRQKDIFTTTSCLFCFIINIFTSFLRENFDSQEVLSRPVPGRGSKKIQQRLKDWGYYKGAVDGIYGRQTRDAVIAFQKNTA